MIKKTFPFILGLRKIGETLSSITRVIQERFMPARTLIQEHKLHRALQTLISF